MSLRAASDARVTVGIPVYNGERYLAEALEALLAQTYTRLEIIVSDNASTDGTADITREYERRDRRIRYVRQPQNIGAGRNFNACVRLARTELFRWATADDLSAPTYVERCVEVLDAHPDLFQAHSRTKIIDEEGNELRLYDDNMHVMHERAIDRYRHVVRHLGFVNSVYGVMRTATLRRTRLYGSYVGADLVLLAEFAMYGKFWEIPEYLFFRRMHRGAHSAMTVEQKEQFYNPTRSRKGLREWRHLSERLVTVTRSDAGILDRLRVCGFVLREAMRNRDEFARELWRNRGA